MSDQLSHSDAAQPTPGITPRRVTLALLVLPTLAALALLAYVTLTHQPHPVNTGDALLDAYLQALVDTGVAGSMESFSLFSNKDALPPSLWKKWEQQFGADPCFWMLCYYARPYDPAYGKVAPKGFLLDANYLRAARKRGPADWIVLLTLLHRETSDWNETARKKLTLAWPGRNSTQEERQRYYAQVWEETIRLHGAELAQLLDELRQAGMDQALVHYDLAQIASERGDMAGALSELSAGNSAPHNDAGLGLPFDAVTAAARQGHPLAGDSAIAGVMALGLIPISLPNFLRYKNMVRAMTAWAVKRQDLAALQLLHRCCCRYGVSDGAGYLQALVAAGAEDIVLDAVQQISPHSAVIRHQALSAARSQRDQIKTALRALGPASQTLPAFPSAWDVVFESAPAVSYGGRYFMLDMLRGYSRDLITQQSTLAGPVRQQFEALAAIDFTR